MNRVVHAGVDQAVVHASPKRLRSQPPVHEPFLEPLRLQSPRRRFRHLSGDVGSAEGPESRHVPQIVVGIAGIQASPDPAPGDRVARIRGCEQD